MTWVESAVRIERFDDADGLRFRATSERRLAALILPMMLGLGLFILAWEMDAGSLLLIGTLGLIGLPVWRWFHVRVTELRVTAIDLVVEGDHGSEDTLVWLSWAEISGLQYHKGRRRSIEGRAETDGLYALKGISERECLIPRVSAIQSGEMIDAIYARFPAVAMAAVETH